MDFKSVLINSDSKLLQKKTNVFNQEFKNLRFAKKNKKGIPKLL